LKVGATTEEFSMPAITPFLWFEEAGGRQPLWRPRTQRVMRAMLQMVKLDVTRLQEAANESWIEATQLGL
jgi:hypothetical protein